MVTTAEEKKPNLHLVLDTKGGKIVGQYRMVVDDTGVKITSASEHGLFATSIYTTDGKLQKKDDSIIYAEIFTESEYDTIGNSSNFDLGFIMQRTQLFAESPTDHI